MKKQTILVLIGLVTFQCLIVLSTEFKDVFAPASKFITMEEKKAEVKRLIEEGYNPNANIYNPLYYAVHWGDSEFTQWLVNNGANPKFIDFSGEGLMEYLKFPTRRNVTKFKKVLNILLIARLNRIKKRKKFLKRKIEENNDY